MSKINTKMKQLNCDIYTYQVTISFPLCPNYSDTSHHRKSVLLIHSFPFTNKIKFLYDGQKQNVLVCCGGWQPTVCQQREQGWEQLQQLIGHPWNNWAGKARGRGIERGQRPHKETDGCYILFFNVWVKRIFHRYEKANLLALLPFENCKLRKNLLVTTLSIGHLHLL